MNLRSDSCLKKNSGYKVQFTTFWRVSGSRCALVASISLFSSLSANPIEETELKLTVVLFL
jgi:hypothetical protein